MAVQPGPGRGDYCAPLLNLKPFACLMAAVLWKSAAAFFTNAAKAHIVGALTPGENCSC